jgi:hypothetical protein
MIFRIRLLRKTVSVEETVFLFQVRCYHGLASASLPGNYPPVSLVRLG